MWCAFLLLIALCCIARSEYYDVFSGRQINSTRYEEFNKLGMVPYCAMQVPPCDSHEPRRVDGSCNNLRYPQRGATFTPFRRLLPPSFSSGGGLRTAGSGKPLPLVRPLRVALMSDGRRPSERYTHNVANYNVFITADITSVHDTVNYVAVTRTCCQPGGQQDPRCIPIEVKDDDVHLRRSSVRCMNLTRAITYQRLGCVSDDVPPERINTAPPMLELSVVYGQDDRSARKGREFQKGRLRAEIVNGKEWPPSGGAVCINNVPPRETRCHDVPSSGVNSVLGINIVFLWFYRSHNAISRALRELNPCWDDDKLYYTAKEINVAFYVQIMYYEMMTELLGWDFLLQNKVVFPTRGHVDDYDPSLAPGLSIEYTTATRWFHTVQNGQLKLYTKDGRLYDEVSVVDFILRTGALPLNNTVEGMTQGVFRQPGADVDSLVDPDVGERILGRLQFASDVLSSDLMKGRDLGLPPYNRYRKLCGLPEAKKFKDLIGWMDIAQVEALGLSYESPDDIDLYAGLLSERPMPGAAVGPTLACIMAEQLRYWRRSDRFWYENNGHPAAFTEEQLLEIRKMTLAKLICQHGDGVDAVQPYAFILPGPGNEITKCSEYKMPNLNVFRDERCYPKTSSHVDYSSQLTMDYLTRDNLDINQYKNALYSGENININPTMSNYATDSIKLTNQDYSKVNPIKFSDQDYPNVNPIKLTIQDYPNVNPIKLSNQDYPNVKPIKLSNQHYPNVNPIKVTNQDYPNVIPIMIRNQDYPNVNINFEPSTNQGYPNLKMSSLYPNANPKVKIYPNADASVSERESSKVVSINGYSNPRFDQHPNGYPGISRNSKYSVNLVLRNPVSDLSYGKSSTANPFQAFFS